MLLFENRLRFSRNQVENYKKLQLISNKKEIKISYHLKKLSRKTNYQTHLVAIKAFKNVILSHLHLNTKLSQEVHLVLHKNQMKFMVDVPLGS